MVQVLKTWNNLPNPGLIGQIRVFRTLTAIAGNEYRTTFRVFPIVRFGCIKTWASPISALLAQVTG